MQWEQQHQCTTLTQELLLHAIPGAGGTATGGNINIAGQSGGFKSIQVTLRSLEELQVDLLLEMEEIVLWDLGVRVINQRLVFLRQEQ